MSRDIIISETLRDQLVAFLEAAQPPAGAGSGLAMRLEKQLRAAARAPQPAPPPAPPARPVLTGHVVD